MGTNVENERDQKRMEEARLAQQRSEVKRLGDSGEFKRVVASMQQHNAQATKQDAKQQEQKNQAKERLMVRQGRDDSGFTGKLAADGDKRLGAKREETGQKEGELSARRSLVVRTQGKKEDAGQQGNTRPGGGQAKKSGKKDDKKSRSGDGPSRSQELLAAHSGMRFVNPLSGLSTKSSTGAGAAPLTSQQVIDQIVKAVRQGIDAKGLGLIEVDLKDDVLAGAKLQIRSTGQGISLHVQSDNADVSRLLSSGATGNELAGALRLKNITLQSLEVNHRKVLG